MLRWLGSTAATGDVHVSPMGIGTTELGAKLRACVGMLQPHAESDSVLAIMLQLSWNHPSDEQWFTYMNDLLGLSKTASPDIWCNLFMGDCQIPFQAFDHEELRNRFCEICTEKNKVIQEMKNN